MPPKKEESVRGDARTASAPAVKKGTEIADELNLPEMATTRVTLRNGLRLIIRERYALPLAAIVATVQTGRRDETDADRGVAALTERMIFRGTTRRPNDQPLADLHSLGAVFRSATEDDRTIFRLTVPADNARRALDILADVLQHPTLEADALRRELEILRVEQTVYRPDALSLARALQMAFPDRRVGVALNPGESSLPPITLDQLRQFYRRHYRAEKIVIAIVGAVNTVEMIEAAQALFGDFEYTEPEKPAAQPTAIAAASSEPKSPTPQESAVTPPTVGTPATPSQTQPTISVPPQQPAPAESPPAPALRYAADHGETSVATVTFVHRTSGFDAADWPSIQVLATVLGQGRASRLWRSLGQEKKLVFDVTAKARATKDVGYLAVQLRLDPANLDRAESAYFEEIERLRRELIAPGELQRAKSLLERAYWEQLLTYEGEARALAADELFLHDFRRSEQFLTHLAAVSAEDVQKASAAYLVLANTALHEYLPETMASRSLTGETVTARLTTQIPGLKESTIPTERLKRAPEVTVVEQGKRARSEGEGEAVIFSLQPEPLKDFSVFEGPRAFVREDRRRPVVMVGIFFQGGRLFESASTAGITELTLRAMLAGVGGRTPLSSDEVALRLEQWGAQVTLVNEPDFCGFLLSVPSHNQEAATRLLVDLIEHPAFREVDVAREQEVLLGEIRARADDLPAHSSELTAQGLYGELPYGWPRWGYERTVKTLTREQVVAWYDRLVRKQFPVIFIVGDTDGSALISSIMAREIRRDDLQRTFYVSSARAPSQPVTKVEERACRAAVQTVGFLGPAGSSDEMFALTVWHHLAFGPGGVIRRSLQHQQALAAWLTATVEPRVAGSSITIHLISSPESETPARQALQQELSRYTATALGDEELRRAITATIGAEAARREHPGELLLDYARRFFLTAKPQSVEADEEKLRALTSAELQRVVSSILSPARWAVGIIRPRGNRPADKPGTPGELTFLPGAPDPSSQQALTQKRERQQRPQFADALAVAGEGDGPAFDVDIVGQSDDEETDGRLRRPSGGTGNSGHGNSQR